MNLLEAIQSIFNFQDWKDASALPGWRARPTKMKHARTPYSSGRKRAPGIQNMHVEEFATREARNERFRVLRERGTHNVSRFTVSRATGADNRGRVQGRIVWCVVRP